MVGGPERELKEAMELPQESAAAREPRSVMDLPAPPPAADDENAEDPGNVVVTGGRRRPEEVAVTASRSPTQGITETPATTRVRPPPFEKTPETWYAFIEKLRAQGKVEEADRQLARLEEAHPGWVERYLQDRAER